MTTLSPADSIRTASVEPVSAAQSSQVPSPAVMPGRGEQSGYAFKAWRDGSVVKARLVCHLCGGTGSVEVDEGSETCGCGRGWRVLETTDADFAACLAESLYGATKEQAEYVERLLTELEDEATAAAFDALNGRPYFCAGSPDFRHSLIGLDARVRCPVCGLMAAKNPEPADYAPAFERAERAVLG